MTGNPIRSDIVPGTPEMKAEAMEYYGLDPAHMKEFWVLCALVSAMAVWRHRANIKRLMEGTENKLWGKKE